MAQKKYRIIRKQLPFKKAEDTFIELPADAIIVGLTADESLVALELVPVTKTKATKGEK